MGVVLLPTNADVTMLRTPLITAFVLLVAVNRALHRGDILLVDGGDAQRAEELASFAFVVAGEEMWAAIRRKAWTDLAELEPPLSGQGVR